MNKNQEYQFIKSVLSSSMKTQAHVIINLTLDSLVNVLAKETSDDFAKQHILNITLDYFLKNKQVYQNHKSDTPDLKRFVNENAPTVAEVMRKFNWSIATAKRKLSKINARARKIHKDGLHKSKVAYVYFVPKVQVTDNRLSQDTVF